MKTELIYNIFRRSKGVSTDTRTLKEDELFFALSGPSFNGNLFIPEALGRGAIAAVTNDPSLEDERTILVDDCLAELQALAARHRMDMNVPVLAVTGTNGKTTTKELLALVLSKKYQVHYTKGNLNNHIGVPLTILSAPEKTGLMIIEMGANHPGEIKTLCAIARPDYGLITNVGKAHLEGFGSFEGVIRTKSELYDFLASSSGTAIYNDTNTILSEKVRKVRNAVPYSNPAGHPIDITIVPPIVPLTLKAAYLGQTYPVRTNLFGTHNLENVKAAFAAGLLIGVGISDIIDAVSAYRPGNNRSEIRETKYNTLICDSYNANPTSMAMALNSFNEIKGVRKSIIIGDMFELGSQAVEEHKKILDLIRQSGTKEVYLVGPLFRQVAEKTGFRTFYSTAELIGNLTMEPLRERTILIKGSRGMALEKIYDLL